MDDKLKATLTQKLEGLGDEQAKQLLDYIEFLDSKYNRSSRDRSPFERLADNVEGTLRASKIGGAAIKGTAQVLDAATSVVRGVAEAGMAVVDELQRFDQESVQKESSATADTQQEESKGEASEIDASHGDQPSDQSEPTDASTNGAAPEEEEEKSG